MSDVPTQICAFLAFCQSASRPPTVIMLILAPGVGGRVDIYNTLLYLSTVVEDTNEIMKLHMKAAQFVTFKGWWFYSLCEEGGRWPWVCNFFANWNPDNKIRTWHFSNSYFFCGCFSIAVPGHSLLLGLQGFMFWNVRKVNTRHNRELCKRICKYDQATTLITCLWVCICRQ